MKEQAVRHKWLSEEQFQWLIMQCEGHSVSLCSRRKPSQLPYTAKEFLKENKSDSSNVQTYMQDMHGLLCAPAEITVNACSYCRNGKGLICLVTSQEFDLNVIYGLVPAVFYMFICSLWAARQPTNMSTATVVLWLHIGLVGSRHRHRCIEWTERDQVILHWLNVFKTSEGGKKQLWKSLLVILCTHALRNPCQSVLAVRAVSLNGCKTSSQLSRAALEVQRRDCSLRDPWVQHNGCWGWL